MLSTWTASARAAYLARAHFRVGALRVAAAAIIAAGLAAVPIGRVTASAAQGGAAAWAAATCGSVSSVSASSDTTYDKILDSYGNYPNSSPPQWTGGDGAFSVGVSSGSAAGRDYWFFGDTFNGPVSTSANPPTRQQGSLFYARNSMVPQMTNGLFTTTAFSSSAGPDNLHDYIPAVDASDIYWPGSGFTQNLGGSQQIQEFYYLTHVSGSAGTDTALTVATINPVTQAATAPATVYSYSLSAAPDAVFFGGSVVNGSDGYYYIYGGPWNHSSASIQPYLARVAVSASVTNLANWQFFEGFNASGSANWGTASGKTPPSSALIPLSGPFGNALPVTSNFSVTQVGGKYVMMTMDGSSALNSLTHIVYYWACTPYGPWYGPGTWSSSGTTYYVPPEVQANNPCVVAYFPQFHPEHTTSAGQYLLSYSLNTVQGNGCDPYLYNDNVNTYRPGFADLVFTTS